jgi:hypothetical protein
MNVELLFYTRKDFGGWRRFMWLPVSILQGKYVHCEVFIPKHGIVFNADLSNGVEKRSPSKYNPSYIHKIDVDEKRMDFLIEELIGKKYSWGAFFGLLLPKWGDDPKGFICSELVARFIKDCCVREDYKILFKAVPPYRWSPNQLYCALNNLEEENEV